MHNYCRDTGEIIDFWELEVYRNVDGRPSESDVVESIAQLWYWYDMQDVVNQRGGVLYLSLVRPDGMGGEYHADFRVRI